MTEEFRAAAVCAIGAGNPGSHGIRDAPAGFG